ncbi:calcium/calmodulin-dependent 3',5'-cyclic nucleotide phosphodiesterase 1-like isoform X3 [Chrysoperla carnea]|uniref:calcium/calmodulin-dependent 3',5'-cyclic nucleotide phosphodiesterase 1-like isoform X3 n=1 Tax=Chrysoperla carnea TaxID=189513 RepID=UPI001D093068|nr:calcium/calmodulin-dependent 3',5'-cyclic nucleotide phosphodiesterase 1-like isoform X3 [Chrysoperla carnea]
MDTSSSEPLYEQDTKNGPPERQQSLRKNSLLSCSSSVSHSLEHSDSVESVSECTEEHEVEHQTTTENTPLLSGIGRIHLLDAVRKDLIHKCNSAPGGSSDRNRSPSAIGVNSNSELTKTVNKNGNTGNNVIRPPRHRSAGSCHTHATTIPPRKCVLTLDGYSYVIEQGSLTIVRRSSGKKSNRTSPQSPTGSGVAGAIDSLSSSTSGAMAAVSNTSVTTSMQPASCTDDDSILDTVDLSTDNLPAVDTPDACDKAALRLRCLLRQLQCGEISADLLQRNLHYAARVLEAVFIDETKETPSRGQNNEETSHQAPSRTTSCELRSNNSTQPAVQRRRLRTPVWARRLADEDDELSEVQPDAVPPEVREWLASTFTRQLATTRRKADEKPKFRSVAHAIRAGIFVDRIYRRVSSSAMMQFPPEVVKVLKTLDDWSFDVFGLSEAATSQPLKYLGYDLLNRYGMIHKFKVPPSILETFLSRIEDGYCKYKNPYHNNLHAADVAQTVHYMLCQTGLMNWLTDLEIFATLVAAIIHDYEHTGTTNNFHVMSGTETALLYNDRAVLENHHISAAFRVMKDDECNILQNLSRDEFREFRTLVIDMVLATDMSFHFQQLKNMKNLISLAEPTVDKSKAVSLVLHCCDISHPAKEYDLHHRWTMLLLEEFFRQGDKEQELGLPFSPLCDRNNTLVAESQIGFIEFIVEPSLSVCSDMLEVILGPFASANTTTTSASGSATIVHHQQTIEEKPGSQQTSSPSKSKKTKIQRPWVHCLLENKRIWKEQAAKDAEIRAQNAQQQENPPSSEE